jgi:hypothetical protein
MTMPNFLVIGAARSGTTALYRYLRQHPQIYTSSIKEPRFFAYEGDEMPQGGPGRQRIITDLAAYRALFEGVSDEKAIGEMSPLYLYSRVAPQRIKQHIPDVKLIAVLRNPVERAYSHFLLNVRNDREPIGDFGQALLEEETRIRDGWRANWHYKARGFYYTQLRRYFELFEKEQIRVYLYQDLSADPLGLLRDLFTFLGIDEGFVPDLSFRPNVSGIPRSRALRVVFDKLGATGVFLDPLLPKGLRRNLVVVFNQLKGRNLVKPPLASNVRRQLTQAYREDILALQGLIGRDLSTWLEQSASK